MPAAAQAAPAETAEAPDTASLLALIGAAGGEQPLPGLTARIVEHAESGVKIHVFDVDPARFRLRVAEQKMPGGSLATDMLDGGDNVLVINGGFFERDRRGILAPSGLLISDGATLAGEHDRAGSGIIYSDGETVGIAYRKDLPDRSAIRQAIQVGPILVDPGGASGIHGETPDRHNRSAACLRDGIVSFFVVEGGMTLFQLAGILSTSRERGGFGCDVAINLDGGPSTQASLRAGDRQIDIADGTAVQNFIVISQRP